MPSVRPKPETSTAFRQKRIRDILRVVQKIPRGRVASYGQVAALAGHPNQARLVGWILRGLPTTTSIPWQRVVNHRGYIPSRGRFTGSLEQIRRLRAEGVRVTAEGELSLAHYRWLP